MSLHFDLVDETKKCVAKGDYSFQDVNDQVFMCKLLVHAADLSNPVRPFHVTEQWARRIRLPFSIHIHIPIHP